MKIVHILSRNTETKSPNIERVIRTIKEKIFKYFSFKKTFRYIDILTQLIDNYNKNIHSRTKFAPINVNHLNEKRVFYNLYGNLKIKPKKPILNVSDLVRIAKLKNLFDKGYTTNWSNELFKISKVIHSIPYSKYRISDLKGKQIIGSFYDQELQKVKKQ